MLKYPSLPAASAAVATGSVLEVIRGASAVSVDGSGGIAIRGNSNVLILVDGIPTTLGGLESIPAANVQSIEIVTSPDVKYDSEGTGGIVNIISKKQSANMFNAMAAFNFGFNGFLNGNVGFRGGVTVNRRSPPPYPYAKARPSKAGLNRVYGAVNLYLTLLEDLEALYLLGIQAPST